VRCGVEPTTERWLHTGIARRGRAFGCCRSGTVSCLQQRHSTSLTLLTSARSLQAESKQNAVRAQTGGNERTGARQGAVDHKRSASNWWSRSRRGCGGAWRGRDKVAAPAASTRSLNVPGHYLRPTQSTPRAHPQDSLIRFTVCTVPARVEAELTAWRGQLRQPARVLSQYPHSRGCAACVAWFGAAIDGHAMRRPNCKARNDDAKRMRTRTRTRHRMRHRSHRSGA
jgi:hypothetical protein